MFAYTVHNHILFTSFPTYIYWETSSISAHLSTVRGNRPRGKNTINIKIYIAICVYLYVLWELRRNFHPYWAFPMQSS